MSSHENDNDTLSDASTSDKKDTSSEAAGVVRGVTRSFKGMIRFPGVGSLPRHAVILKSRRRLPVQRVATVSDRLSTGIDLFQTAVESEEASTTRLKRVTTFCKSLVKNTLLGAAVFETFEYMVTYLAPEQHCCQTNKDVYARASLGSHFLAGACGGFVHAIPSTLWDKSTAAASGTMWSSSRALSLSQYLPAMIIHHSIAHSFLFGFYESIKREFLRDEQSRHDEIPYICSVSMAGGLAGQIQHVISHYTEQWLLLGAETTTTPRPLVRFVASPPTLRPTLLAFPPSAISFVAFEYGKRILT